MVQPEEPNLDKSLPPTPPSNPIAALGRKVKDALSTESRPSVRLRRGPSLLEVPQHVPNTTSTDYASAPQTESQNEKDFGGGPLSKLRSRFGRKEEGPQQDAKPYGDEYDADTVNLMDVLDPEVATLSTLTNVQNSLFIPSLGKVVNRRPTYRVADDAEETKIIDKLLASLKRIGSSGEEKDQSTENPLANCQYAILPDGMILEGWSEKEKAELDDAVRHQLHSRRAKMKRSLKGFTQYVRRPLGLFVTVYATLITLFGAAWVLFLIGWISIGSKRDYVINVVDNVLVALFAIIGDGLAPFRAVDTYHMAYIAHYHRKTWKKRDKLGLPHLADENDLPEQRAEDAATAEGNGQRQIDVESLVARKMPRKLAKRIAPKIPQNLASRLRAKWGPPSSGEPAGEYTVLTPEQQAKLDHHTRKFSKSHTFYKPHETETHYAFPLRLLICIVVLLDMHSCLQISLGACTWGIPYETRPFALTTVILCCSITCNIAGGVLISIGDKRTRKKDVIERMMIQDLTSEAIDRLEARWLKEAEERGDIDPSVRKQKEAEKERKEREEDEEVKQSWKEVPLLPKKLLGKGEDHRQPSLPQDKRRGSRPSLEIDGASPSTSRSASLKGKEKGKSKSGSTAGLPTVSEGEGRISPRIVRKPVPTSERLPVQQPEAEKEGTGQKVMSFFRKADLDRS